MTCCDQCRAEEAEAERDELRAALADRDRRIAAALAYCDDHNDTDVGDDASRILRGTMAWPVLDGGAGDE
jgi:hypothetical protein